MVIVEFTPRVRMFPPILMAVKLASVLVAERAPSAVTPPTAPTRVIVEVPAFKVRAWDPAVVPLIAPPKEITPGAALVLIVVVPATVNTVGIEFETVNELAVIFPPIERVLAPDPVAEEMVMAPSRVVVPTVLEKVIVPAVPEFRVRVCPPALLPLTTEEKLMFAPVVDDPPTVLNVPPPAMETFPVRVIAPPCVVMLAPTAIATRLASELVAEKAPNGVFVPKVDERVIVPAEPEVKVSPCAPAELALT